MSIAQRATRWLEGKAGYDIWPADNTRTMQGFREKRIQHDALVRGGMDEKVAWQLIWMMHKDENEGRLR